VSTHGMRKALPAITSITPARLAKRPIETPDRSDAHTMSLKSGSLDQGQGRAIAGVSILFLMEQCGHTARDR
jgi:hypothetical protein